MDDLGSTIKDFTDEELATACFSQSASYTPEALRLMREELSRRGLSESRPSEKTDAAEKTPGPLILDGTDFVPFVHSFTSTDWLLARAVLLDNDIPFIVDNPTSTNTFPIEAETEKEISIRLHKDSLDKCRELLDEHFILSENKYRLKYSGARERLKAFNFHDVATSEAEAAEEVEVSLTEDEKRLFVTLGRRLLKEPERVEKEQDRILFYYDSIDELLGRLATPDHPLLSRNDLLTLIEILQVYVNDPALPPSADEAIAQLLSFFFAK